jgi:uncharacterized membrane protein
MNRNTFLKELRRELEPLPFDEREAALTYYEEYFDEAGPEGEREAIATLGTPAEIALGLKVDYAVNKPPKTPKEGRVKAWMIILAFFTLPITLPLALGRTVAAFVLLITFGSVIFALGVSAVAILGGAIVTVVAGFGALLSSPLTFLFFLGTGAALLGIGVLTCYITYIAATKLAGAFARLMGRVLNRVKARQE